MAGLGDCERREHQQAQDGWWGIRTPSGPARLRIRPSDDTWEGRNLYNSTAPQTACLIRETSVGTSKMIFAFIPPDTAPQVQAPCQPWPTPGPRLSDHEARLLAVVRQSERHMATVWTVVNTIVRELAPSTRNETRRLRVTLLHALNQLLHRGLVHRHERNFVKLADGVDPASAAKCA